MRNVQDVIAAFASQIGRGRAQADAATLELANAYRDHPILSSFPIPKMLIDEVAVELKVAIAAAPGMEYIITQLAAAEVVERICKLWDTLPESEQALAILIGGNPGLAAQWPMQRPLLMPVLVPIVPMNGPVNSVQVAGSAASAIQTRISAALASEEADVPQVLINEFQTNELPGIIFRVSGQIRSIIEGTLQIQAANTDQLDVLITASELENISADKIATVKFRLREQDRSWTVIETDDGALQDRLVPH